jgi:2-polyprenyl-3-methyl-5-hydroxy-6-metoxy-1,4-benzoquinol methylase
VYAINSAYPRVIPDMWFGLDRLACHHPRVWFEPFPKITSLFKDDTEKVRYCPEVYYATLDDGELTRMFLHREPDVRFSWERSTFLFALHFLYWRGHKTVYLVGSDHGGTRDYWDDRQLTDAQRDNNRALHDRQLARLRQLAPIARQHGLSWISCTPGSRLNDILPYVPLEEALANCTKGMPENQRLLHSTEADAPNVQAAPVGPRWAAQAQRTLLEKFKFKTVLDVGCGTQLEHSIRFAKSGKKVSSVDHQAPAVKVPKGVDFIQGKLNSPRCAVWKKQYDCVWMSHILEHQRNPGLLLDYALRALNPNGILAVTVPPLTQHILGGHVSVWNMGLLCYHIVSAGLDLRGATLLTTDGNITVIAQKKMFDTSKLGLRFDKGDIEKLSPYFPTPGLAQGFDGRTMKN